MTFAMIDRMLETVLMRSGERLNSQIAHGCVKRLLLHYSASQTAIRTTLLSLYVRENRDLRV